MQCTECHHEHLGAACMPELRRRRGNGRSWSGYADIFQDQRYQRNGYHFMKVVTSIYLVTYWVNHATA
ncbi:MAG: hypothetical protein P8163_15980 [Candidatus Thiodiazotropha sp.]